ncbi:MAG: autoinducer binding domain-containing protein [Emcibacter sp.]|nr:autoinducer binding domain-containing protein [Emcibacter sp.]
MIRQKPTRSFDSLRHLLAPQTGKKGGASVRGDEKNKSAYQRNKSKGRDDGTAVQKELEEHCQKVFGTIRSQQEFTNKISDILERLGFTGFSFTALTPAPYLLYTSLSEAFLQTYHAEGFMVDDYDVRYRGTGPTFRSAISQYMAAAPVETSDMARNREIGDLYKSHGLYDSYLIPVTSAGDRFVFCVTTQTKNIANFHDKITAHAPRLLLLAKLILQSGKRKFKATFDRAANPPKIKITPKPLRVLQTLALDDLTLIQAAEKLGISIHTADKHSAVSKQAFGASTLHGAVYKAIQANMIRL